MARAVVVIAAVQPVWAVRATTPEALAVTGPTQFPPVAVTKILALAAAAAAAAVMPSLTIARLTLPEGERAVMES